MLHRYPDYYSKFKCVANKCEATCCAGWEIQIDEDSLTRYKEQKLDDTVNYEEECFYQDDKKNCAYLREDYLCNMVIDMGENALCDTCRLYPRHIEEFENVREYSLSISCPEVAKMILTRGDIVSYFENEDDTIDETEDYNVYEQEVYLQLFDLREDMLKVLTCRNVSLEVRCVDILKMALSFQERLDDDQNALYISPLIQNSMYNDKIKASIEEQYIKSRNMFETQKLWEYLTEDWPEFLEQVYEMMFANGPENYHDLHQKFDKYSSIFEVSFDVQLEQIITYFLYTYFCGSAYDEYYYGQAQLAIVVAMHIRDLVVAKWQMQGQKITQDEICRLVYLYSRELEHSNSNVYLMEQQMEERKLL